jgi:hypothetical protein
MFEAVAIDVVAAAINGSLADVVGPIIELIPPDIELPRCRIDWATFWREKLRTAEEEEEFGDDWTNDHKIVRIIL